MISNYKKVENRTHKEFTASLIKIAVDGLHEMYVPNELEFALRKRLIDNKFKLEGRNTRYTLINLIGLHKAESHNIPININLRSILFHQISNAEKYNNIGELGLLLWASALISPDDIVKILTKVNFNNILRAYDDAKSKLTNELSWFLTGLLMASTFSKTFMASIGDLTLKVYLELRGNYGGAGIFKHQGNNTIIGKIRGNIASFADQVYPIYAFSLYSQQMQNEEACLISKECASKLCELQGDKGEWMWHYNSKTGQAINKYPVFSVNQIALAPIALSSIQKASGTNFEDYINMGVNWVLNNDLVDYERKIIWDGVSPQKIKRKLNSTINFLGKNSNLRDNKIEIIKECSSYNYGWILHSLSAKYKKSDKPINNSIHLHNLNLLSLN